MMECRCNATSNRKSLPAAFAERAWKEGAKALALRMEHRDYGEDGYSNDIKELDVEISAAPAAVKPILRCLQAHFHGMYYTQKESSVRVQHAGKYQPGIAEIRCMYAPEFNARSASGMLEVAR